VDDHSRPSVVRHSHMPQARCEDRNAVAVLQGSSLSNQPEAMEAHDKFLRERVIFHYV